MVSAGHFGARETFGYEQLVFEPLLGGGLIAVLSPPLISRLAAARALVPATAATLGLIVGGFVVQRRAVAAADSPE